MGHGLANEEVPLCLAVSGVTRRFPVGQGITPFESQTVVCGYSASTARLQRGRVTTPRNPQKPMTIYKVYPDGTIVPYVKVDVEWI